MTHFDHMTSLFLDFIRRNQPVLTDSKISPLYRAIRDDYAMFLKQATIHLSCVDPETDVRGSMKSSQLYRSGRSLLMNWAAFIESTNELENDGLQPYVDGIEASFGSIFDSVAALRSELPVIRYKTDVPVVGLQNFQDTMLGLRTEIYEMIVTPKAQRFEGFEEVGFKHEIGGHMHLVTDLFNRALLHSGISPVRSANARAMITASLAAIAMSVGMAQQFDESFDVLRQEICRLNEKLTVLFDLMRSPFEVALILDNQGKRRKKAKKPKIAR
jgi:hypothetical protein